jgi:hypothetical protein
MLNGLGHKTKDSKHLDCFYSLHIGKWIKLRDTLNYLKLFFEAILYIFSPPPVRGQRIGTVSRDFCSGLFMMASYSYIGNKLRSGALLSYIPII